MRTFERLDSAADYLIRMNALKPLDTLNDDELQALIIHLGLHKTKADMTRLKLHMKKISEVLNYN